MVPDTFKEFIISGIENDKFNEYHKLLRALVLIKWMTLIDEQNAGLSKSERKKVTGITIPHTASYRYIMKHIESNKLLEIINNALVKIEKSNLQYKGKVAFTKEEYRTVTVDDKLNIVKGEVIRDVSEFMRDEALLKEILYTINDIHEEDFELIDDFLHNRIDELHSEHKRYKRKELEENRLIVFKGDIPISVSNFEIFDKTFIAEQWIRRIIMFVLMTEYGSNWIKAFNDKDLEDYESMRRRLAGREKIDLKDDHLLWYASLTYLGKFIKREDISERIEKVIDLKADAISNAVFKVSDIRNEMAHNRTITKKMEDDYQRNFDFLDDAIKRFKGATIHSKNKRIIGSGLSSHLDSGFVSFFHKCYQKALDVGRTQAFVEEEKNYYAIVLLPCEALGSDYINISKLLATYSDFKDHIIAFYVSKTYGEYQITVHKTIGRHKNVYRSIIRLFFDSVKELGTNLPYELQDPKYICNPKIWFYDVYDDFLYEDLYEGLHSN